MIDPQEFIRGLALAGVDFITGVPDSLLKDVCAAISNHFEGNRHIIATNEGSAVAMAIGHYLATEKPALVYLQNSGLGNTVNPLTSLAAPEVYGIPMILMIGWRGELLDDGTQQKDEPQHIKQGQITLKQLELMGIPYSVIDAETPSIVAELQKCVGIANKQKGPVALVVRKNSFSKTHLQLKNQVHFLLKREEVISKVLDLLPIDTIIVSTTGMPSRELFELRKQSDAGHHRDFLTVGGMGHASQIAAGIALARPEKQVVCLDGDGAVLMHAGGLAISADCPNFLHIVLNNEAHDSVGGQPTKGNVLRFDHIAEALKYQHVDRAVSADELSSKLTKFINKQGSRLLEVCCKRGARDNLARPNRSPSQNKADFMKFIRGENAG
jgi:phosphonopyruvate decarboxylase